MKALFFGEILWDVIENKPYIGGAPFNLAAHMTKMGFKSTLISSVGKDALGRKALKEAEKRGINSSFIRVHPDLPTGIVEVSLDERGHPTYLIKENVAWDNIVLNQDLIDNLTKDKWEIFCFGTLAQRTKENREVLSQIISQVLDEPFTGVDPIAVYDIQEIISYLKEKGLGILITDHNVRETLKITDQAYIMHNGKILTSGTPQKVANCEITRKIYLGERFNL